MSAGGRPEGGASVTTEPAQEAVACSGQWREPLLERCSAAAERELTFAEEPAPLGWGHGTRAFSFRLRSTTESRTEPTNEDDPWGGGLVLRLASAPEELHRETSAMELSRAHRTGATAARGIWQLDADGAPPLWALVCDAPVGIALLDLIGLQFSAMVPLMRGFGAHHAAVHRIPVAGLPAGHRIPVLDAAQELSRIDAERFSVQCEWLGAHASTPAAPVLCHGGYQPSCVYGLEPAEWERHGGPGASFEIGNWSGAMLADAECDVALTQVCFWIAHFHGEGRAGRAVVKALRSPLINDYIRGYPGYDDLDRDRLRFWRAFHALRWMARLQGAYEGAGSCFEVPDRAALPGGADVELERFFRQAASLP